LVSEGVFPAVAARVKPIVRHARDTMERFREYNKLIYGETLGWRNGKRLVKDLTPAEYDMLLSLLTHWKTRLRWSTADRLGKITDHQAVEPLISALRDSHWLVRLHAAKALGRIGNATAVRPLIDAIADECPYVRRRIVTALGTLGSEHNKSTTPSRVLW
jgi:HEAT repeat protein